MTLSRVFLEGFGGRGGGGGEAGEKRDHDSSYVPEVEVVL